MKRCPCNFCNAPNDPPRCLDCGHIFTAHEEWNVDGAGNPMCFECYGKMTKQPTKEDL